MLETCDVKDILHSNVVDIIPREFSLICKIKQP